MSTATFKQTLALQIARLEDHYRTCRQCHDLTSCRVGAAMWDTAIDLHGQVLKSCLTKALATHHGANRVTALARRMLRTTTVLMR